jgi:hypothetical protein
MADSCYLDGSQHDRSWQVRCLAVGGGDLGEVGKGLAGDVALEASHDLGLGLALGDAAGDVVAGGLVAAAGSVIGPGRRAAQPRMRCLPVSPRNDCRTVCGADTA